jgi:hypothetical protein
VVLVNKGVAFAGAATDALLAAVLPKYAESMAAAARATASVAGGTPAVVPRTPLAPAMVGVWVGVVHSAGGDVPVQFTIAASGEVQARIGGRTEAGVARASTQTPGRLVVRVPGDLEAPSPAGMNRQMAMYLDPRGAGFGGAITTRPPSATGLDGSVSYWLEIARRREPGSR